MADWLISQVPDEVWDRYFHKFQIKIFSGVFLECKPSGYTHNDELIYSRWVIETTHFGGRVDKVSFCALTWVITSTNRDN